MLTLANKQAHPFLNNLSHALLLLSDSALPLGSFAFSSGLESYLAHHPARSPKQRRSPLATLHEFLHVSLTSQGSITIPYVLAAYRVPSNLESLDNDLDASTACAVARRASIAQGRALLSVYERVFHATRTAATSAEDTAATFSLLSFSRALKEGASHTQRPDFLGPNGHFGPLWALVCRIVGIPLEQTAYVFMLNHAKAITSAAVRASLVGPYQAQGVLASEWLQTEIQTALQRNWEVRVEDAGQEVPVLDLWVGRHELLYSRIFNS